MKTGSLLMAAFFAAAIFSPAQDKIPAAQDTAKPPAPTAPAPAATSPALPALVVPDSYVIGESDVVMVTVFKEPSLSSSLLVRSDGMIALPLLGDSRHDLASGNSDGRWNFTVRQREKDVHPSHCRREAAEDTIAIQASIEGRQLAQSHIESGRYVSRTVRQPE